MDNDRLDAARECRRDQWEIFRIASAIGAAPGFDSPACFYPNNREFWEYGGLKNGKIKQVA